jgi:hypothetical protein
LFAEQHDLGMQRSFAENDLRRVFPERTRPTDVGVDTRYGVDDNDYKPPFPFTGKLAKLTIKLVPSKMTAEEKDLLRKKTQDVKNGDQ